MVQDKKGREKMEYRYYAKELPQGYWCVMDRMKNEPVKYWFTGDSYRQSIAYADLLNINNV